VSASSQPIPFEGVGANIVGSAGPSGQILYLIAGTRGLFESKDGGLNWTPLSLIQPGVPNPEIAAFLTDPVVDSTLYVGTTIAAGAIWKSTDSGATWARANNGLPASGDRIESLWSVRDSPLRLYARMGTALFRSTDGGATWRRQATLPGTSPAFDITNTVPPRMWYAQGAGVQRSLDEGVTWTATAALQTFGDQSTGARCIVNHPVSSSLVYACVAGSLVRVGDQAVAGVHKSDNGGSEFRNVLGTQPVEIFLDPSNTNVVTAGSSGGYCRTAGAVWTCPPDSTIGANLTPTSARISWLDPRTGVVYARGGKFATGSQPAYTALFRSTDAGQTWQEINARAAAALLRPDPIAVTAADGAEVRVPLNVTLLEIPRGATAYTATVSAPWLSLSAVAGMTPAALQVSIRPAGLAPGTYDAVIELSAPRTINQKVTVVVRLTVPPRSPWPGPAYIISTFAGNGSDRFSGDDGPAIEAGLGSISGLARDARGNLYLASSSHHRLRRISPDGRHIITIAGNGTRGNTGDGGPATAATLDTPNGVAADNSDIIYAGSGNRLRRIVSGNIQTAVAGDMVRPASFGSIGAVARDPQDRIWLADLSRLYRYIPPAGVSERPLAPFSLGLVNSFAFDPAGNLLVATSMHRIVRIAGDTVTTIAGTGLSGYAGDGVPSVSTPLNRPRGMAADAAGNIFFADASNHRIRMITAEGSIHTIAGTGAAGFSGDDGLATAAQIQNPDDLVVDASGAIYFADGTFRIRVLRPVPTPPPVIGSIRNAASGDERLSPGALVFIDGENLAAVSETAETPPLPVLLGRSFVTVNDQPAPLLSVSPGRLAVQIPAGVSSGEAQVAVLVNGRASARSVVLLQPVAPGIFSTGDNRAIAVNPDGSANGPDAPAPVGGNLTLSVTGFGATDPPLVSGTLPPPDATVTPALPFTAMVGDLVAEVVSVTMSSVQVGVAVATIRLPVLEPGEYAVVITVGGVSSNAPVIVVGPSP